ncbi:hypothetical protein AAF712_016725 [Marasmius tenuissimus]|uniref:Integrase core domain-containing protein n=1 Tax=Marasmius tenuissimus TaxID=585030 RepID=A0ABR2Z6W3_9AGAR
MPPSSSSSIPPFITLPVPDPTIPWSPNILNAAQRLTTIYNNARAVLGQESDSNRLKLYYDLIRDEAIPLLEALERESVPEDWITEGSQLFGRLASKIARAESMSKNRDDRRVRVPKLVRLHRTGKRGRPAKVIDENYLKEAMGSGRAITISKLAKTKPLSVHRNTLRKYIKGYNIESWRFSRISNRKLDEIVRHLRSHHGLRVQRHQVLGSIARVDGLGVILRRNQGIRRRKYKVSRPNALWHIDGHHKLILWGFVVHGIVDGYGRDVVAIRANTNNRASTVLENFINAIDQYGVPSRTRGDYGTENKLVALYMILKKGQNRGSFIWGSSTRNTRIERLWVEVGRQFARQWRAFFYRLESLHSLKRSDRHHIWLLQYLFLDMINVDCDRFQEEWNAHPISGEGHNMSPNDMRFIGMSTEGVYVDDCNAMDEGGINDQYGVDREHCPPPSNQTGAGTLSDEEFSDTESSFSDASSDSGGVRPPTRHKYPAPFDAAGLELFKTALAAAEEQGFLPEGYGVLPGEWEDGEYPSYELLRSGKKGTREIRVDLPNHIWRPRAEKWVQALDILVYMLEFVYHQDSE